MANNVAEFWAALGRLTFAETLEVAATLRDAEDCVTDFEITDAQDWSFLLNAAREIAQDRSEEVA
jgi:hypothetical protein